MRRVLWRDRDIVRHSVTLGVLPVVTIGRCLGAQQTLACDWLRLKLWAPPWCARCRLLRANTARWLDERYNSFLNAKYDSLCHGVWQFPYVCVCVWNVCVRVHLMQRSMRNCLANVWFRLLWRTFLEFIFLYFVLARRPIFAEKVRDVFCRVIQPFLH